MNSTTAVSPPLSARVPRRRRFIEMALAGLDAAGFREIDVPLLAPFEEIRSAVDESVARELFRFAGRSGEVLVLRGDVTPVVAWQYARHLSERPLPLRLSYAARVARVRQEFARYRIESHELGAELIGAQGLDADVEILSAAVETLDGVGAQGVECVIGHVGLSASVIDEVSKSNGTLRRQLDTAIAAKDRNEAVEMARANGASAETIRRIKLLTLVRPKRADLAALAEGAPRELADAVLRLQQIIDAFANRGWEDRFQLDLSRRNERGYYSGVVFSLTSPASQRALGGGGRYDRLIGRFGVSQPAIGFGLRVETILDAIDGEGGR